MSMQYIEPTTAGRAKLVVGIAVAVGIVAAMDLWWGDAMSYVQSLPFCERLPWLRALSLAFAAMLWAASGIAGRAAWLIYKSGQTPFPGAWVWSRTKVRTGLAARASAAMFAVVAVLTAAMPPVAGYALRINVIFCYPEGCDCGQAKA